MRRLRSVLTAAALLSAAALAAQPAPEPAPAAQAAAAAHDEPAARADDERKICRTEKVTGSLSRRNRICLTAAQWREVHDRTRKGVDELTGSASGGKICHPDPADPFQGCPG